MNGIAANRAICALATTTLPIGVRELADLADVSPGSVSKLLVTLSAEGIVDREHATAVTDEAIEVYRAHASTPQGRISLLVTSAAQGDPTVAPAFASLVTDLLWALRPEPR